MGRPKKSKVASRANGSCATNKGLAVNVKEELFGYYADDGTYVIKKTAVRREMAKGETRRYECGWEGDVFTFCLYHGKGALFTDEAKHHDKHATYGKGGVNISRWEAAQKKAAQMLEACSEDTVAFARRQPSCASV